jgi:hypothetical protein
MSILKKILLGSALLVIALIGAASYLIHRLYSQLEREQQVELQALQPQVVRGAAEFQSHEFYKSDGLGNISQIKIGWPANLEGASIAVVGDNGADFLDDDRALKKHVEFSAKLFCPIEIAPLDKDGGYGYLTRDEGWSTNPTLFGKTGEVLWDYPGGTLSSVDDSAAGDIVGSGRSEVVIGLNGMGGIILVNDQGRKIWQKAESNVWHVETLDANGDGRKEIIHSNARGELLVRNSTGEVVAHYLPQNYVTDFILTKWGEESEPEHLLVPTKGYRDGCCKPFFALLDARGTALTELDSPYGKKLSLISATPVRFSNGRDYFAVLQTKGTLQRSALLLYNSSGQIAYQELLRETCRGLAALPSTGRASLLVGCAGKVLEFTPTTKTELTSNFRNQAKP